MDDGWTVAVMSGPRSLGKNWPRCCVTRNDAPRRPWAAVDPRQTTISGLTRAISASSHGWQALTSYEFGLSCSRRLPGAPAPAAFRFHLKCLTMLVTYA